MLPLECHEGTHCRVAAILEAFHFVFVPTAVLAGLIAPSSRPHVQLMLNCLYVRRPIYR